MPFSAKKNWAKYYVELPIFANQSAATSEKFAVTNSTIDLLPQVHHNNSFISRKTMFTTNKGIFQTASSMQSSLYRKSLRCASFVVHSACRNIGVVSSPSTTLLSMIKLAQLGVGGQTNQLVGCTRSLRTKTKTPKKATAITATTSTKNKSSSRSKSHRRKKKKSGSDGKHSPRRVKTRARARVKRNLNLQKQMDLSQFLPYEREFVE